MDYSQIFGAKNASSTMAAPSKYAALDVPPVPFVQSALEST